ncbi:hypothetical protein SLEP1_g56349 [Rubroshorea leprosula]|uniref:Uncharacterized protein n=1 Tax=Rubroshorea leprosula TaxID=152421 RepID=A0AAV5ML66_9ROSI|nr:hypothetical protein SLEP1_g56349 [Rubroshorea leprosula]
MRMEVRSKMDLVGENCEQQEGKRKGEKERVGATCKKKKEIEKFKKKKEGTQLKKLKVGGRGRTESPSKANPSLLSLPKSATCQEEGRGLQSRKTEKGKDLLPCAPAPACAPAPCLAPSAAPCPCACTEPAPRSPLLCAVDLACCTEHATLLAAIRCTSPCTGPASACAPAQALHQPCTFLFCAPAPQNPSALRACSNLAPCIGLASRPLVAAIPCTSPARACSRNKQKKRGAFVLCFPCRNQQPEFKFLVNQRQKKGGQDWNAKKKGSLPFARV